MSGTCFTQTILKIKAQKTEVCEVIKTAGPIMASMLASTAADMATQIFMARLGKDELTANQWAMTYKLFQTALSAPMNALYGLLGNKLGAIHAATTEEDRQTAREAVFLMGQQGLYYALASASIVATAFYFSGFVLGRLFHENAIITGMAQRFLRWYLPSVLAFSYGSAVRPYLCVLNQRSWVSSFNYASVPLMVLLGYGFGLGGFGFPKLGIEGLALAAISRIWFNAIASTALILCKTTPAVLTVSGKELNIGEIKLSGLFKFKLAGSWDMMKELLQTGLPLSVRLGVEWSSAFFGSAFYNLISSEALTVASAVSIFSNLIFTVTQSLGNAGVQILGTMVGAKNFEAAYRLGNISIILPLIWATLWCVITPFIANPVSKLFLGADAVNNPLVLAWLPSIMSLTVVAQVFDGLRYAAASAYQGLTKKTIQPMLSSLFGMGLVGLSLSYGLGVKAMKSPEGVATGAILGNFIAGSLCLGIWFRANYQSTDLPQESKPCTKIAACFNRRHRLQPFGNGGQYGGVGEGVVPSEEHREASGVLSGSTTFRTPSGKDYFKLQDGTSIEEGLSTPPANRSSSTPVPVSPVTVHSVC